MRYMTHNEIRNTWLKFFEEHKHMVTPSAPLVPINDDSLLWINAGVTPLKKYFDGREVPANRRITNVQKCIRTNDIENVGVTKRHQTFFEMMGNFSVGDYFRKEAISFAYELLTSPKYFGIDKSLIYVTHYTNDLEARDKWIEEGLDPSHLVALDGNFWEIGEGPCGPDSEIFFDRGEKYDNENHNALELFKKDEDQERYVEIWNIVFSQYNAKPGVKREEYKELPSKNIDTGAGLERWCCIFQGVDSNFETDLFKEIINYTEKIASIKYNGQKEYKVIADHIRAVTFALADNASFENYGRGYVLRRLLRRSIIMGKKIGIKPPFMYKIAPHVSEIMKEAYPYIVNEIDKVVDTIKKEEELFLNTLEHGENKLKELISSSTNKVISGEDAAKLYDTYGFPIELTKEYLEDLGYTTSIEEFNKYMEYQKDLSRKNQKQEGSMSSQNKSLLEFKKPSEFQYHIRRIKSTVIGLFLGEEEVKEIHKEGYVVFDKTCFYATMGGQIADTGMVIGNNFKARVVDVFKGPNGQNIHKIKLLDGIITIGDKVDLQVDEERRKRIEANHSATHLLQYALQQVISKDIYQAGSLVDENKLRFDFIYKDKISEDEIYKVEDLINDMISKNLVVSTEIMDLESAKKLGAMALFSEKYKDNVRVIKIGKSIELCGGTHTDNTRSIEHFAIYLFSSIGNNTYRIEAATKDYSYKEIEERLSGILKEIDKINNKAKHIVEKAKLEKIDLEFNILNKKYDYRSYEDIIDAKKYLAFVSKNYKDLEKKYNDLKEKNTLKNLDSNIGETYSISGNNILIIEEYNKEVNILKALADNLIKDHDLVFVIGKDKNNINYICKSNGKINAGNIIKNVTTLLNGRGGGSSTFAQGRTPLTDVNICEKVVEEIENE